MDERRLIEKLLAIEALFGGAATEGERVAADRARRRILDRLEQLAREDPPVEYRFTMADMWSRKVFVALLRRYGIQPYRYRGQRYTTVMAMIPAQFVEETLWPQFKEYTETLQSYLSDVTERVVSQVIHQDSSEAEVVSNPKQLTHSVTGASPTADQSAEGNVSRPSASDGQCGRGKGSRPARKRRKRKKGKRHSRRRWGIRDAQGEYAGKAYLAYGPAYGTYPLSSADAWFVGEGPWESAGVAVEFAGDVNGDGYDDLLIGANYGNRGGVRAGNTYLLYGPVYGELELAAAPAILIGVGAEDESGDVVGAAGDVNQDGYDDILIGARQNDRAGTNAGAAYLLNGPLYGVHDLSTADATFLGESADDHAGLTFAGNLDADGDGVLDVLVGAMLDDENATDAGAVYLLYGN